MSKSHKRGHTTKKNVEEVHERSRSGISLGTPRATRARSPAGMPDYRNNFLKKGVGVEHGVLICRSL